MRTDLKNLPHTRINMVVVGSSLFVIVTFTFYLYFNIIAAQTKGVKKEFLVHIKNKSTVEKNIPIRILIDKQLLLDDTLDNKIDLYKDLRLLERKQMIEIITHNEYVRYDSIEIESWMFYTLYIDYLGSDNKLSVEFGHMFHD